ncbi:MAG: branched-chain amino acid ABC transporter permease [Acutalibacteraceae bacterium]|nr:branched-chain amino acid ABC transporter permease [Oscillospiraceae bacterium]
MKNLNKKLSGAAKKDLLTYVFVIAAFIIVNILSSAGVLGRSKQGLLVPICCYIVMALSLNLTVGVMGELSLGHAGFMSIGAFTGVVVSMSLVESIPSAPVRLLIAMVCGAVFAGLAGLLIGIPVLRLRGDYLAIVTLAFGEIIKELINCLIVGYDTNGLHIIFNFRGDKSIADLNLVEGGTAIIKGAQGATGTKTIATFTAGFILILVSLFIILNFVRSRTGRAVLAIRDNRIAAESVGINIMKYKMIAFVISTAIAGAAGALYGLNYSNLSATKFDFNTSILVLVFVVLGGLGNMLGSIIAATVLYILPEALREFADYRMLLYAIVLILVMLATNSPKLRNLFQKIIPFKKKEGGKVE